MKQRAVRDVLCCALILYLLTGIVEVEIVICSYFCMSCLVLV